jgi:hypothetical protein
MASLTIPIKTLNNVQWGDLSVHGPSATHIVCGEQLWGDGDISLFGGHRVRSVKLKKNVHWRVLTGFDIDIAAVPPPPDPPRRQGKRHNKNR